MILSETFKFKIKSIYRKIGKWIYSRRAWVIRNLAISIILTFTVLAILFVATFPHTSYASWHLTNSGTIGDSVGGMTAPFIGILNAILLWWTLKSQNQGIILQNLRTDLQKRLDGIDVAIRSSRLTIKIVRNERVSYQRVQGTEAFFRAQADLWESQNVSELRSDPNELEVLLKNSIGIYRSALLAVDQNDQILAASQNTPMEMSTRDWVLFYEDLSEQIDDVREFWQAYRRFFERNINDNSFMSHRNTMLYHSMRDKFDRMQSTFQFTVGPQEPPEEPEPDWR